KQGTETVGSRTKAKVVKNKVAPPFKTAEFDIMYGQGISREGDLLDIACNIDIVQKSGSWYSYEGERMGQGRENAKDFIKNNPEIYASIEKKVKDIFVAGKEDDESFEGNA
ncbi:MAG: DNA recombination/repair protein RecA, partial [Syntrophomonadaceae bacterium]|nr:DNA recombination/repair protein RecA [Syntrophomonadaceae bacterium]